jgi:hypothetical protein
MAAYVVGTVADPILVFQADIFCIIRLNETVVLERLFQSVKIARSHWDQR